MSAKEIEKENIFGEQLKILRSKLLKQTQKEFSQLLDIPQPTLSAYETGRIKPTIDVVAHIADVCNVSIESLYGRESGKQFKTMGDLADFLFDFYNIQEFRCQTTIPEYSETEPSVNPDDEPAKGSVSLTFFPEDIKSDSSLIYSSEICKLLQSVSELHKQLDNYECSQDYYDTKKSMIIERYKHLPITRIDHSGISESERTRLQREKLKEELRKELLMEQTKN